MRSRLLQSFLFVLGFWWIGTAMYWGIQDADVNLDSLRHVVELLPWVSLNLPDYVSVLDAWGLQKSVFTLWSGPVIFVTFVSAGIGAGIVWLWALTRHKERAKRIRALDEYRGISLTLGPLPLPQTPKLQPVSLRATDKALRVLSSDELAVLTDVLGLLAANRECFAGEGQPPGSLLQRTLKAAYAALKDPEHPGPAAIVAAASELGKITAWKKDEDGSWLRIKHEQREAARSLAALPSWWALPGTERLAVLYAVKYRGQVENLPEGRDPAVYRLTRALLDRQAHVDAVVAPSAPETGSTSAPAGVSASVGAAPAAPISDAAESARAKAYEQRDPEVEILELFERELAMLPFQTMGLPKNIPAVGWKKGNRAYFLENRLTEHLLAKLRPELRAAYTPTGERVRVQKLTGALLKIFNQKGWLVLSHESHTVPVHEALWVIQAGKLEFSRVIILDLPEEYVDRLPPKDSYYEVKVKRPLFQVPIANAISKDDLLGDVLRPKAVARDEVSTKGEKPAKTEKPAPKKGTSQKLTESKGAPPDDDLLDVLRPAKPKKAADKKVYDKAAAKAEPKPTPQPEQAPVEISGEPPADAPSAADSAA